MTQPHVSIIVLNWNNYSVTKDCLLSLEKITHPNYEVILVDNGSTDGSVEKLEKEFSGITFLKNKKNLGFAAGNNIGIKYALSHGADYILLLNNDTEVAPDFLDAVVKTAESDKKIGIVGAKIYYHTDPKKIDSAGADYIWWRVSGKLRFHGKKDNFKLQGAKITDFVSGCCMLVKCAVFDDIGFLHEPYFHGFEDIDFCLRAKKAGWNIVVDLDAHIWHKVSASAGGEFSFINTYYGARNRLFYAFKKAHNFIGGFILLCFILPIRIVQWTTKGKFFAVKGTALGIFDFFRGKMGKQKDN